MKKCVKLMALLLAVVMIFALCACGDDNEGSGKSGSSSKTVDHGSPEKVARSFITALDKNDKKAMVASLPDFVVEGLKSAFDCQTTEQVAECLREEFFGSPDSVELDECKVDGEIDFFAGGYNKSDVWDSLDEVSEELLEELDYNETQKFQDGFDQIQDVAGVQVGVNLVKDGEADYDELFFSCVKISGKWYVFATCD